MNLKDKRIAITGAARGLGLAIAKGLGVKGAYPLLIDLSLDDLEHARSELAAMDIAAGIYPANVADEKQVDELFANILADHGCLHGLVNNAGILRDGLLLKVKDGEIIDRMSLAQWQAVIDVNLTGVFLCGRAAAEQMLRSQSEGLILNISSISKAGNRGQSNYSAAKAGVAALTVTWAGELARYGIRCAGIAPGFISTDMVASMKPEALEKMASGIPLKRLGKVEEIAHTAVYLFENDYYNGRTLELDGGLRI